MARSDKGKEPDFNDIWVYANGVNTLRSDWATVGAGTRLQCVRYHLKSNGRCIIYKKTNKYTKGSIEYTGNCYYMLGNGKVDIIPFNSSNYSVGYVWSRGESQSQKDGTASEMESVYVSDSTFFENLNVKNYSLGAGGTNGSWYAYNYTWNNNQSKDNNFIPCKKITTSSFNLVSSAGSDAFWIGFEPNYYSGLSALDRSMEYLSGTYVSGSVHYYTMRNYPWKWANGGSDKIITWSDAQSSVYTNFIVPSDNRSTTEDMFDGDPLFINIYITENYEEAIEYINNGTIPSDVKLIKPKDNDGTPSYDDDSNPNDDNSTNENNGKPADKESPTPNNKLANENQSPIVSSVNVYQIQKFELENFISWFWTTSIVSDWTDVIANTLTGMYGNLTQCITSIRKFPISDTFLIGGLSATTSITVGRYTFDNNGSGVQNCYKIKSGILNDKLVANYTVQKKYNNFVDYAPYTSLQLYLPFVGIIPLDTNMVMGREIDIYASASLYTGEIQYTVYSKNSNDDNHTLLGIYKGMCAIDVPYSLDDALSIFTNASNSVSTAISAISGVSMPSIGGSSSPMNTSMSASNQLSLYTPYRCAIIEKRKRYQLPANYASKVGYKCCKKLDMSKVQGLTVITNPIIKQWIGTSPTKEEIDEVYTLMENGIIFR